MLETFSYTLPNGLFLREWRIPQPAGIILAVHGMGTHSGRFDVMARELNREGYSCFCYDHPGHGNSPGKRGHFNKYDDLLDALQTVLDHLKTRFPGMPVFLFGHSMGGNVVANFVLRRKPEVNGVVLSSPWFRLAFDPPYLKLLLAKLVVNIFPGLTQESKLRTNFISHNPDVIQAYDDDPLIHPYITPKFFLETSKAGLYAIEHAAEFYLPLYLYHGTADQVTSYDASKEFSERYPNCTFSSWNGCYHEVHNEWVKKDLLAEINDFLNSNLVQRRPASGAL